MLTSPMMGWLPDIGQLGEGHRVGAAPGGLQMCSYAHPSFVALE